MMLSSFARDIPGFPNYLITRCGNVVNKRTKRILKNSINKDGYAKIRLSDSQKKKSYSVHRLVGMAFIKNPNNLPQINHLDGNKKNNKVTNLEWCDQSENSKHSFRIGLQSNVGIKNPAAKLNEQQVREIRAKYSPGVVTIKQLSIEYNVGETTIGRVLKTHWKHVK